MRWLTLAIPVLPWEAEEDGSPEVRSSRLAWPTWQNPISTKNTNIGRVQWLTPTMSAPWEAKAGRSQDQEFETNLANVVKSHLYLNIKKN